MWPCVPGGKFIEWDQCLRFASDQNVAEAGGVFIIVLRTVKALPFIHQPDRVAPKTSDV